MNDDLKQKPVDYWKKKLTPEAFHLTQEKGTEAPFTGAYLQNHETGMYNCIACGHPLFSSDAKFDSGSGWPSFDQPINRENVELHEDTSFFMHRTKVRCKNCGAHLGHVFPDGPKETTGERFCVNSGALTFTPKK